MSIGRQRNLRKQHRTAKHDGKDEVNVRSAASESAELFKAHRKSRTNKKDPSLETTRRVSEILTWNVFELGRNQLAASQAQQANKPDAEHA